MTYYELRRLLAIRHAKKVKQKQILYELRHKNDPKKTIPTHKIITVYIFIVLNVVLVYALVAMWYFADLTHLGVLITDIIANIANFFIYSKHSTAQTRVGGIQYMALQEQLRMKNDDELTEEEINNAVG